MGQSEGWAPLGGPGAWCLLSGLLQVFNDLSSQAQNEFILGVDTGMVTLQQWIVQSTQRQKKEGR